MGHDYVLWVVVIACAAHVVDEQILDFVGTVRSVGLLEISRADFYVVNAAMIIGAVACAVIGWRLPEVSLFAPALIAINAAIHIVGSIVRRRMLPGLITAVLLYVPTAAWVYTTAYMDGVLTGSVTLLSTLGGALFMVLPVVLQVIKRRRLSDVIHDA
jgi:hypothetical protein